MLPRGRRPAALLADVRHLRRVAREELVGRSLRGVIQGESRPQEFIPKLVDFMMRGAMPLDQIITFYPLAEINRAARNSNDGACWRRATSRA